MYYHLPIKTKLQKKNLVLEKFDIKTNLIGQKKSFNDVNIHKCNFYFYFTISDFIKQKSNGYKISTNRPS